MGFLNKLFGIKPKVKIIRPEISNKTAELHFKDGLTYYRQENFQNAEKSFRQSLSKKDTIQTRLELGKTYRKLNQFENAKEHFLEIYAINPKHTTAVYHLAEVTSELKNFKEAVTYYEKCVELNPNCEKARQRAEILKRHIPKF